MMSTKAVNIILLLLAVQNICASADNLSDYYNTYYDKKTSKPSQGIAEINGGNVNKINFKGISCRCQNLGCSCCTGIRIKKFHFDEEACASFNYVQQTNAITAAVSLNQKQLLSTSFPVKTPPPLCVSIPHLPSVKLCVRFRDLAVVANKLNVCVDVETQIPKIPTLALHFNCLKI
nr:uncharacterized protein LOC117600467 [Osmia lignaria]